MADQHPQESSSSNPSGRRPPSGSPKPQIEAEISPSDAYLLAMKQIDLKKDLSSLGSTPCARRSLLLGISGGAAVGAIRFLSSRRPLSSSNWAVAAWAVISLTSWEACRRAMSKEQAKMKSVVADYRQKVKQKEATIGPSEGAADKHVKGPHIGGVWMGEKGKEMLNEGRTPISSTGSTDVDTSQPRRLV